MNYPAPELIAKLPPELAAASIEHGAAMVKLSPYRELAERSTGGVLKALRVGLDTARAVIGLMVSVLAHLAGGRLLRYPSGALWMPETLAAHYAAAPSISAGLAGTVPGSRTLSEGTALASVVRLEDALWLVLRARHGCTYEEGLSAVRGFIAVLVRMGQQVDLALPTAEGRTKGGMVDVDAPEALGEALAEPAPQIAADDAAAHSSSEQEAAASLVSIEHGELVTQHMLYASIQQAAVPLMRKRLGVSEEAALAIVNAMLSALVIHFGGGLLYVPTRATANLPDWLSVEINKLASTMDQAPVTRFPGEGVRTAEFVEKLLRVLGREATRLGVVTPGDQEPGADELAARTFIVSIFSVLRKQHVYLPAMVALKNAARDKLIAERMSFGGATAVAREFGLSYVRVHQIYRRHLITKAERARAERDSALRTRADAGAVPHAPASMHGHAAERVRALAAAQPEPGEDTTGVPIFGSAQRYARDVLQQRGDRQVLRQGREDASRSDD